MRGQASDIASLRAGPALAGNGAPAGLSRPPEQAQDSIADSLPTGAAPAQPQAQTGHVTLTTAPWYLNPKPGTERSQPRNHSRTGAPPGRVMVLNIPKLQRPFEDSHFNGQRETQQEAGVTRKTTHPSPPRQESKSL